MLAPNCSFEFFMFLIVLGEVAESPEIIKSILFGDAFIHMTLSSNLPR